MPPNDLSPSAPTVIAEIHGETGIIGIIKIGDRQMPLIFEPVESDGDVPPRVRTLWHLLHYLNNRIRHAGCLEDLNGDVHSVSMPLNPETLTVLHRVISIIGVGRVTIKWLLEDASRDGRILHISRMPKKNTEKPST